MILQFLKFICINPCYISNIIFCNNNSLRKIKSRDTPCRAKRFSTRLQKKEIMRNPTCFRAVSSCSKRNSKRSLSYFQNQTKCGLPGFINISTCCACSSKKFSFKWTIVIRLIFSSKRLCKPCCRVFIKNQEFAQAQNSRLGNANASVRASLALRFFFSSKHKKEPSRWGLL